MALADNLVGYWKLDEGSGDRADSVGANTLTDNNAVYGGVGQIGNAALFYYWQNPFLSCADNAALSTGDIDFTVACWVNASGFTGQRSGIANKGWAVEASGPNREWTLCCDTTARRLMFVVEGTTEQGIAANNFGVISSGIWYFVVAWHDSVNNLIGIQVNDTTPDTISHSGGVHAGSGDFAFGVNSSFYWYGLIDEAGFWKRVLTPAERAELYNDGAGLTYPFPIAPVPVPEFRVGGPGMEQYRQHLRQQAIALDDEELLLILSEAFGVIK